MPPRATFTGCLTAALLHAWAASCAAATYYVATTGNNANSGLTRSNAWATIQRAVDATTPGDIVAVLSGTYVGVRFENSGTPDAPIILRPDAGATVILNTPSPANKRTGVVEIETYEGSGVVSNVIVEGLHVFNSPRYGIDARSAQFVTIRGNTISNSQSTGIFTPFCYDIVIEDNTSLNNGEHGIYYNNSSDHFVIRNNECHHNTHAGIHLNGDASVPPPDGTPWVYDGTLSFGLIENNLIHDNGTGGAGINMDGVTDTIVRNNILFATPNNSGIAVFHGDAAVASQRNWFLNNVILMAQGGGWCLNIAASGCVSNRVFNNVFFHPGSADGSIVIPTPALQGFACDYNVVATRFSLDNDNSRTTLTAWRAAGFDAHSIVATPANLFVDLGTRDYRLKTNSPAIDVGTAQPSAPLDRDGISRPLDGNANGTNTWDIGAYEYLHPTTDSDHDRMSDLGEQIAGTDATNPASVFGITQVDVPSPDSHVLSWPSMPGRLYTVWHGTNITTPFLTVASNLPATPPENTHTSPATLAEATLYRLDVRLEP